MEVQVLLPTLILLSSAVERATVNRLVPGSNPGEGVRSNSSAVEHLIYIQVVGGSIPSSSINKFSDANEGMKNVNCKM